jgi:UMF1 family MFS transporter
MQTDLIADDVTGVQVTASKKIVNGWAMYDWANSVYNLVITSTIFPAYYESITKVDGDDTVNFLGRKFVNTALYNYAIAFAILVVAVLIPILSSIADYKGNKKNFMRFFCTMGSVACCGMFFFTDKNSMGIGIFCVVIACIGFWSSLVFYNSYLPEIAAEKDRDMVSAKGFTMGYIGSVLLQVICLVLVFSMKDGSWAARLSFVLVGLWWIGWAQIPFNILPKGEAAAQRPDKNIFANGFIELKKVLAQVKNMPVLKRFLAAFFFYNMGVQTVMLAAALFGAKELNLPTDKLIITILIIQLVAIAGAYLMAKLAEKYGNLQVLAFVVVIWIVICIAAYFTTTAMQFYFLGAAVGLVMGGIQSLSRSTYSKLMPETKDTASFFSFYDVSEKIAIVIGMFTFGLLEELTGNMRNSVLAIMIFFIIGLFILLVTISTQKKIAARS